MLGQAELRKWINTAVVNELYADKPSEITRLSLLRAKFAEKLAGTMLSLLAGKIPPDEYLKVSIVVRESA